MFCHIWYYILCTATLFVTWTLLLYVVPILYAFTYVCTLLLFTVPFVLYPILLLPKSYATILSLCASLCTAINTLFIAEYFTGCTFFHGCKVAITYRTGLPTICYCMSCTRVETRSSHLGQSLSGSSRSDLVYKLSGLIQILQ